MIILTYGETSTTPLLSAKPANLVLKVSKNKIIEDALDLPQCHW